MRRMTAFDQRLGGDGHHRFLHRVEHRGQLLAAAFDFGKVLAQVFGRLVERGFHGAQFIFAVDGQASTQVAFRDAAREGHDVRNAGRHAAGSPGGQW